LGVLDLVKMDTIYSNLIRSREKFSRIYKDTILVNGLGFSSTMVNINLNIRGSVIMGLKGPQK